MIEMNSFFIGGQRLIRRIIAQQPLAAHITGEMLPGIAVQSDDDLLAFARATGSTAHYPVGTCAMGTHAGAVGVVDASIMPMIVSGDTHAATVMIADQESDLIPAGRN
jgi:choline dehydrogenase